MTTKYRSGNSSKRGPVRSRRITPVPGSRERTRSRRSRPISSTPWSSGSRTGRSSRGERRGRSCSARTMCSGRKRPWWTCRSPPGRLSTCEWRLTALFAFPPSTDSVRDDIVLQYWRRPRPVLRLFAPPLADGQAVDVTYPRLQRRPRRPRQLVHRDPPHRLGL